MIINYSGGVFDDFPYADYKIREQEFFFGIMTEESVFSTFQGLYLYSDYKDRCDIGPDVFSAPCLLYHFVSPFLLYELFNLNLNAGNNTINFLVSAVDWKHCLVVLQPKIRSNWNLQKYVLVIPQKTQVQVCIHPNLGPLCYWYMPNSLLSPIFYDHRPSYDIIIKEEEEVTLLYFYCGFSLLVIGVLF